MATGTVLAFALGAAVFFSTYGLLSRVLSIKSENPVAFASLYGLFAALASFAVFLATPFTFRPVAPWVIGITFVATVLYGIQEGTQFFMRKHLEASRTALFYQLTPIVTFITSFFVLHETASLEKILGIALIVSGNIVAVYENKGNVTKQGVGYALITVVALGFAYIADKIVVPHYPIGFYMTISYLLPALYVVPFISGNKLAALRREIAIAGWRLPVLGVVSVAGYYCILRTFSFAEVSLAVPIAFTGTILTVLGGIVILGERSNMWQKVIAAVLVFAGVLCLN